MQCCGTTFKLGQTYGRGGEGGGGDCRGPAARFIDKRVVCLCFPEADKDVEKNLAERCREPEVLRRTESRTSLEVPAVRRREPWKKQLLAIEQQ